MKRNHQAFTLIELLVVVLIIGILAAVAVPKYQVAVLKTRYVQLMVSLRAVEQAVLSYHLANGVYPTRFDELDVDLPGELTQNNLITFGDYSCRLYEEGSGMSPCIYCKYVPADDKMLAYRWTFGDKAYICETLRSWDLGQKVCRAVAGQEGYTFGDDPRKAYIIQ